MTRECLEKFAKYYKENKECQEKIKELRGDDEALSAYIKSIGFDFSAEDMQKQRERAIKLLKEDVAVKTKPGISLSPGEQAFYGLMKLAEEDSAVGEALSKLKFSAVEDLITFGKEKGFIFDKEDLKNVIKNIIQKSDDLSDEDLELVAGGCIGTLAAVAAAAASAAVVVTSLVVAACAVVDAVVD